MNTFEAIAEPNRRRILDLLRADPRTVGELVESVGLSQPGVSKHLRVLREAELVRARPEAQRRVYEIRPDAMEEILAWVEPYRHRWGDRLDALERDLDRREREETR